MNKELEITKKQVKDLQSFITNFQNNSNLRKFNNNNNNNNYNYNYKRIFIIIIILVVIIIVIITSILNQIIMINIIPNFIINA